MHKRESDQMLPKSLMQYVSECTLPSFSYVHFTRESVDVRNEHGEEFHQEKHQMQKKMESCYAG